MPETGSAPSQKYWKVLYSIKLRRESSEIGFKELPGDWGVKVPLFAENPEQINRNRKTGKTVIFIIAQLIGES